MGDDLALARRFTQDAKQTLDALLSSADHSADSLRTQLDGLKAQAAPLRAKAILRAVNAARNVLNSGEDQHSMASALTVISQLVQQYTHGLNDVAPDTLVENDVEIEDVTDIVGNDDITEPELSPALELPSTEMAPAPKPESETQAFERARETLGSVTSLIKDDDPQAALVSLMNRSFERAFVQPSENCAFESLMPGLTNAVLSAARQSEKTVSVSYMDDGLIIPRDQAEQLEPRLRQAGQLWIQHCLELPHERAVRGLSQGGHLSFTVATRSPVSEIHISGAGRELPAHARARIENLGGQVSRDDRQTHIVFTLSHSAVTTPLTDDTLKSEPESLMQEIAL